MPTPSPTTPTVTQAAIRTMERHGGSFVQKLAALWCVADLHNKVILENAFRHVFDQYEAVSSEVAS